MTTAVRSTGVRSERGVALIVVLLLLALLLTIVAEFAQAMRLEAVTATNFRSALSETWLAEAAYQRALAEILPEAIDHELDLSGALVFRRSRTRHARPARAPGRADRPGAAIVPGDRRDRADRISTGSARDILDRLLQELDVEKTERDVIVDSIQDWRDPNEEHRLNGAESDYYLGLTPPYRSKNADFDSVDELLQVRGVTRALLYGRDESPGLAEFLTVFGTGAINVNTASPVVLRAPLGLAQAEVEILIARRPYVDLTTPPAGAAAWQSADGLRHVPHRGLGRRPGAGRPRPHRRGRAPDRDGTEPGRAPGLAMVGGRASSRRDPAAGAKRRATSRSSKAAR